MRSNSGNDQSRNNLHDPTVRERTEERTNALAVATSLMPKRPRTIAAAGRTQRIR